ncbi:MAG TPA: RimK family alpha-L-glutamate ligase [Spirochaetia bacterium]|nr:RimK family alpha-L-glutamate ligase [Spirochaetia bacterium]
MSYQEQPAPISETEQIPRLTDTLRPVPITGAALLTKLAFRGEDLDSLLSAYQDRIDGPPDDAGVVLDMSTILQLAFNREPALEMQSNAIAQQQIFRVAGNKGIGPETTSPPRLRVLALVAPGDLMVNTPLEFILSASDIRLDLLYLIPGRPLPTEIPDHDVAFVAVSEPDLHAATLQRLRRLVAAWPRPIVNDPSRILLLSRESVYSLLNDLPGVTIPLTLRIRRTELEQLVRGEMPPLPEGDRFDYPILVRPVGSHAGNELRKLDDPEALSRYLATTPQSEFYLMPFIDYRGTAGMYRKLRVVFIQGAPYLCHMAVSENWMIHYLNAGMTESADKRAEEAAAMKDFDADFATRHSAALRAVSDRLGLDYFGIDCGETRDGRLLVFEADVAMVIHDMDPPDLFPYKGPQMRKVFRAFEGMLESIARAKGKGAER